MTHFEKMIEENVRLEVGVLVMDQVWDQLRRQVEDQVWNQVRFQDASQVGYQVRDQLRRLFNDTL